VPDAVKRDWRGRGRACGRAGGRPSDPWRTQYYAMGGG
jgi:hypothetical protein